ncbi:hypothetical protein RB195_024802 [Necator americanus]|uniref:CUB domain protein n=1 Tax=Necator americanus TaxID=51031 RepID=A0ABR1EPY4_NECAM
MHVSSQRLHPDNLPSIYSSPPTQLQALPPLVNSKGILDSTFSWIRRRVENSKPIRLCYHTVQPLSGHMPRRRACSRVLKRVGLQLRIVWILRTHSWRIRTCGGVTELDVTRSKQYLTTPFYGRNNYPPKMNCYYALTAQPGNRILIKILDVDMEAQIFRNCLDFIGFYEGKHVQFSRPYLSFCGQLKDRQVTSQGPALTILFSSDELIEGRGANISYEAVAFGECDAGWLSREDGNCYRYIEAQPKVGWVDAQDQCSQMQANLASIRNKRDFDYMIAHAWIGYTDADDEGSLMSVDSTSNAIWPKQTIQENGDVNDCLYLDYSRSGRDLYRLADCRKKQTFICQKRSNWSTVAVESQRDRIRRGAYSSSADYTIWLLILVALILFVILFCILLNACLKNRERNRVSNSESNQFFHGSDTCQIEQNEAPHKSGPEDQVDHHTATVCDHGTRQRKAVHLSPTQTHVVANVLELHPFPVRELPKLVDEVQQRTSEVSRSMAKDQFFAPVVDVFPALPPTSLPPLSIHETTPQSMNTREESFLRNKQSSHLFDRPKMNVLENVSAISLDEFWSNTKN